MSSSIRIFDLSLLLVQEKSKSSRVDETRPRADHVIIMFLFCSVDVHGFEDLSVSGCEIDSVPVLLYVDPKVHLPNGLFHLLSLLLSWLS